MQHLLLFNAISITWDFQCNIQFEVNAVTSPDLLFLRFRPSFPRSRFLEARIRSSTTRMSTSHLPCTSSPTWSPTASTRSGWLVTAARVHPTGRPGWSSAPNKEVRPPSVEMFVRVWSVKLPPSEEGQSRQSYQRPTRALSLNRVLCTSSAI